VYAVDLIRRSQPKPRSWHNGARLRPSHDAITEASFVAIKRQFEAKTADRISARNEESTWRNRSTTTMRVPSRLSFLRFLLLRVGGDEADLLATQRKDLQACLKASDCEKTA